MALIIVRNDHMVPAWKEALQQADSKIRVYGPEDPVPAEEILMAAVWKHPPGSLNSYPNLKGIHCLGAGVDFILEDNTVPHSLPIMRVVDPFLASDMGEYVLAQVLSCLKVLHQYKADQMQGVWRPKPYLRIEDVTVGIMGLGTLGLAVAKLLSSTGFSLVGWTRKSSPNVDFPVFSGLGERREFLAQSDILVCLLPLTSATRGILDNHLFGELPNHAWVINAARGGLLKDSDLLQALDSGKLSGACLDVFHSEPLPPDHLFWEHPRVHMTPHVASVSDPKSVAPQIVANYHRLIAGEPLTNLVSRSRGY
jgi:glyoxylate/hydroxypyruvate reductase A